MNMRPVNLDAVAPLLESKVLAPARKRVGAAALQDFPHLHLKVLESYLELVVFIKLLDPTYLPPKEPAVLQLLRDCLSVLSQQGSADNILSLRSILAGKEHAALAAVKAPEVWFEKILAHFTQLVSITDTMSAHLLRVKLLKPKMANNRILQDSAASLTTANQLLLSLDPATNVKRFESMLVEGGHVLCAQFDVLLGSAEAAVEMVGELLSILGEQESAPLRDLLAALVGERDKLEAGALIRGCELGEGADEAATDGCAPVKLTFTQAAWSPIQKLVADPSVSAADIGRYLSSQTDFSALVADLNSAVSLAELPLHLAIALERADVVEVLLDNDAKVHKTSANFLPEGCVQANSADKIRALLHFHLYQQQLAAISSTPFISKAISLTNVCGSKLQVEQPLENAVLVLGATHRGKSTVISAASCSTYVRYDRGITYALKRDPTSCEEAAPTNDILESETICPQIVVPASGKYPMLDTPGSGETRGLAWSIAGGVSMQLIGQSVNTVKAIVAVFMVDDLKDLALTSMRATLAMVGHAVHMSPELLKSVLFVANKAGGVSAQQVFEALQDCRQRMKNSAEVDFVMSNLRVEQVLTVDIPDSSFKTAFWEKIETLPASIDFAQLNFAAYHTEATIFKSIVSNVAQYHAREKHDLQQVRQHLTDNLREQLANERAHLDAQEFAVLNPIDGPANLQDAKNQLVELLAEQERTCETLQGHLQTLDTFVSAASTAQDPPDSTYNAAGDQKVYVAQLAERTARIHIADRFLTTVAPFMLSEGRSADAGHQTCTGSAFPFAGACAGAQRLGEAEWAVLAYVLGAVHLLQVPLSSIIASSRAFFRFVDPELVGNQAPVCAHQWPGVWKHLLPRLSAAQAGATNQAVRLCSVNENRATIRISAASSVLVLETTPSADVRVTVDLAESDVQFGNACIALAANSFGAAFAIQAVSTLTSSTLHSSKAGLITACTSFVLMTLMYGLRGAIASLLFAIFSECCLQPALGRRCASWVSVSVPFVQMLLSGRPLWAGSLLVASSAVGSALGSRCGAALSERAMEVWSARGQSSK